MLTTDNEFNNFCTREGIKKHSECTRLGGELPMGYLGETVLEITQFGMELSTSEMKIGK
jgi:hypothetical protein